jgi:dCTP deaminase
LDIFTRVITDHGHQFDDVKGGYKGPLFLEVVSRTFTIKVKSGLSLNQLRLVQGDPSVPEREIIEINKKHPLLYSSEGELDLEADQALHGDGILLSVDLLGSDRERIVGYKARPYAPLLDLSRTNIHRPEDYWEEIRPPEEGKLILEPETFYLLISWERVSIPPDYAAEMVAYEPTSGELRTHYAGFFDPGFGVYPDKGRLQGTRAVMEVRARDVAFMIEHKQKVCRLRFEQMSCRPEILYGPKIGSFYQGQNLILSKHFLPASAPGQQIRASL